MLSSSQMSSPLACLDISENSGAVDQGADFFSIFVWNNSLKVDEISFDSSEFSLAYSPSVWLEEAVVCVRQVLLHIPKKDKGQRKH